MTIDGHGQPAERDAEQEDLVLRVRELCERTELAPVDAAALVIARELDEIGADAAFVATLAARADAVDVARVTRWSARPVRLAFPLDAPYPLAKALRDREPLFIADNEQLRCDHPGLVRVQEEDHACATLPLVEADGSLLGALNLGFEDPHDFSAEERAAIAAVAERCARALGAALRLRAETSSGP